jgi:hypothetical protein
MELTRENITRLLQTNDRAVERAITVLFDRQTQDEKATSTTRHENQRGFSCAHSSKGSYYARWIRSGRHLTGWHLENARRITQRYVGQLLAAAQEKQSKGHEKAQERRLSRSEAVQLVQARARKAWDSGAGGYRRVQEHA